MGFQYCSLMRLARANAPSLTTSGFSVHGLLRSKVVMQNLLELVANEMATESCQADAALVAFHANTLAHLAACKAKGGARYDALQL